MNGGIASKSVICCGCVAQSTSTEHGASVVTGGVPAIQIAFGNSGCPGGNKNISANQRQQQDVELDEEDESEPLDEPDDPLDPESLDDPESDEPESLDESELDEPESELEAEAEMELEAEAELDDPEEEVELELEIELLELELELELELDESSQQHGWPGIMSTALLRPTRRQSKHS